MKKKVISAVYFKNTVFVGNIEYFGLCLSSQEYSESAWSEPETDKEGVTEGKKFKYDQIRINHLQLFFSGCMNYWTTLKCVFFRHIMKKLKDSGEISRQLERKMASF